jgi:hypothetical protein
MVVHFAVPITKVDMVGPIVRHGGTALYSLRYNQYTDCVGRSFPMSDFEHKIDNIEFKGTHHARMNFTSVNGIYISKAVPLHGFAVKNPVVTRGDSSVGQPTGTPLQE